MRSLVSMCLVMVMAAAARLPAQERSVLRLLPTEGRELPAEGEVEGALSASDFLSPDNAYMEAWVLRGETGRSVTVDLISDDFDGFLYVAGPGLTEALYDDDSGGGCNSRLTFTFLEAGDFHVVASTTPAGVTGTFALRTSSTPPPTLPYGCGELDPALLGELPPVGELLLDQVTSGRLDSASGSVLDGQPLAVWTLEGVEGESVTITMRSDDFDTYLFAHGPGMPAMATDDDSAGDLDAQLTLRFPASGRFLVGASALTAGLGGAYTLEVRRAADVDELEPQGTLSMPGTTDGALGSQDPIIEGRRTQAWTFAGGAGQTVTIELVSDDFDSYLTLVGPGIAFPLEDDDSAGDLNSRIVTTLPESGIYRILASSLSTGTGAYQITIR